MCNRQIQFTNRTLRGSPVAHISTLTPSPFLPCWLGRIKPSSLRHIAEHHHGDYRPFTPQGCRRIASRTVAGGPCSSSSPVTGSWSPRGRLTIILGDLLGRGGTPDLHKDATGILAPKEGGQCSSFLKFLIRAAQRNQEPLSEREYVFFFECMTKAWITLLQRESPDASSSLFPSTCHIKYGRA